MILGHMIDNQSPFFLSTNLIHAGNGLCYVTPLVVTVSFLIVPCSKNGSRYLNSELAGIQLNPWGRLETAEAIRSNRPSPTIKLNEQLSNRLYEQVTSFGSVPKGANYTELDELLE